VHIRSSREGDVLERAIFWLDIWNSAFGVSGPCGLECFRGLCVVLWVRLRRCGDSLGDAWEAMLRKV
jgi:hypothetical protein